MNKYQNAVNEIEQSLEDLQDYMATLDSSNPSDAKLIEKAEKSYNVWTSELKRYKDLAKG